MRPVYQVFRRRDGAEGEGICASLQEDLGGTIRIMGVKDFAAPVGVASPNVLRAINPRHNPTQETLNRLLKPFGLKPRQESSRRRYGHGNSADRRD